MTYIYAKYSIYINVWLEVNINSIYNFTEIRVTESHFESKWQRKLLSISRLRVIFIRLLHFVQIVFRHIAMGRRCWLNSGSHEAATNIAFMYSLFESCKMNGIDFGEYVEDILTRMMNGDDDYRSMIPCNYK